MRPEAQIYFETARRYLEAAKVVFQSDDYWEVIHFLCYHAFECLACAGLKQRRNEVPSQHVHFVHRRLRLTVAKIKAFKNLYQRAPFYNEIRLCTQKVSTSQREWALYPKVSGFAFVTPVSRFDRPTALSAIRCVDRLFSRMESEF